MKKTIISLISFILIIALSSCAFNYYPNSFVIDEDAAVTGAKTLSPIDNSEFGYNPSDVTLSHQTLEEQTAEETTAKNDKETTSSSKTTEKSTTKKYETQFSDEDLNKLEDLDKFFAELDKELADEIRDFEDEDDGTQLDPDANTIQYDKFSGAMDFYDVPLHPLKQQYVIETADAFGLSPIMIFGVMKVESNYHETSISRNGKYIGVMQVAKGHLTKLNAYFGITDLQDFNECTYAGAYYLSYYINFSNRYNKKYYNNEQNVTSMALMCYHRGEGGAAKVWKKGTFSDSYSNKVMNEMARISKAGPVSASYVINKYSLND